MAELLVAGSVALDTLEGPFGTAQDELGGSALYFALAAALLMPVKIVAPVGRDAEAEVGRALRGKPIDSVGLSLLDAPTYRWHAKLAAGHNLDLGSSDNIYDVWQPQVSEGFSGWAFIGSMRPKLQVEIAASLHRAQLLAADAMRSYVDRQTAEARQLLPACDWFFCNDEELRLLAGSAIEPADFRAENSLTGLCLKAGSVGATVYTDEGPLHMAALRSHPVIDTTGAGDALAGGFLARWILRDGRSDALADALAYGLACASIAIEDIGLRSLRRATERLLLQRVKEVMEYQGQVG